MNHDQHVSQPTRTIAHWARVHEHLARSQMQQIFADEPVGPRGWRTLQRLRDAEQGKGQRQISQHRIERLRVKGLIEQQGHSWSVTTEGEQVINRISEALAEYRARAERELSTEDLATAAHTLEAMARNLGWEGRKAGRGGKGAGPGSKWEARGGRHRHGCRHHHERGCHELRGHRERD